MQIDTWISKLYWRWDIDYVAKPSKYYTKVTIYDYEFGEAIFLKLPIDIKVECSRFLLSILV